MNQPNQLEQDKSTAATTGNRINSDHIQIDTTDTDVLDGQQDQTSTEDGSGIRIPVLPPLAEIDTSSSSGKRKGNSMCFDQNNTVRRDWIEAKRQRMEDPDVIVYPTKLTVFKDCLGKSNLRRIPEGEIEVQFRDKMVEYLREKSTQCCFSQRHNQYNKCTCLKELMENDDANTAIVADIVTSYYGLVHKERQALMSHKVYNVMDQKLSAKLKDIKSI